MCDAELASMVETVLDKELLIPALVITLGCGVAIIWIISATIGSVITSRHRERTKREMAAYVAEGSIDPDKAIAMLEAGNADSDEE